MKIGSKVSRADEEEVRVTVQAMHDFAVSSGMPRIDGPIYIFLYHNVDALAAEFEAATGRDYERWFRTSFKAGSRAVYGRRDFIGVNTSVEGYHENSPEERKRSFARYLVDVYRHALTGIWRGTPRDAVSPAGPQWLTQGIREYFVYHLLEPPGSEACYRPRGQSTSFLPLDELETSAGYSSQYPGLSRQYVFFATEFLAVQASLQSIFDYYGSLRGGLGWREAFRAAFGMAIEEFYQLFEEHRAAGFPKDDCPTLPLLVTLPDSPNYTFWYVGPNVPREYVEEIVYGTQLMHEYASERVLSEEGGRIGVYLPEDMDTLVNITSRLTGSSLEAQREYWDPGFARPGHTGITDSSWIITNTFSSKYAKTPPERRIKVAAHEMFHVYQAELSGLLFRGGDEVPPTGPRWLRDGSAEFFAYKALDTGGIVSYDTERNTSFIESAERENRPLSDMENQSGIRGVSYRFFLLAVELLAHHAGEDAIIRFHALQQPGTTWQEAFQEAFGMTAEEFYDRFEEHRAAGFPEVDIPVGP